MSKDKKQNESLGSIGSNIDPNLKLPTVTVGSNDQTIPNRNTLIGKIISINLKRESYFGVGSIWLTPEKYWAKVPDGLTDQEYDTIAASIAQRTVVLGKQFIAPIDKASNVPEEYWSLIEKTGFESKNAKSKFSLLVRKGEDLGWTAIEIAQFCLDKENTKKKRKEVIKLLTQLIQNYNGPVQLYDPPDTAEGTRKVTIRPGGVVEVETNSGKKVAKSIASPPPKGFVKGSKTAEEAMDDIQ